MICDKIKIEILKEVITKSGFDNNKEIIDSMADAVIKGNFLFQLIDNEVVKFVTWIPQEIDGKNKVFVNNLWIDPRYRDCNTLLGIRKILRNMFKGSKFIWFNRRKQKLIERI